MRTFRGRIALFALAALCAALVAAHAAAEWSVDFVLTSDRIQVQTAHERAVVYRAYVDGAVFWRTDRPGGLAFAAGGRWSGEAEETHHWITAGEYHYARRSSRELAGWTVMLEYTPSPGPSRAEASVYRLWLDLPGPRPSPQADPPRKSAAAAIALELIAIRRSDPIMLYASVVPHLYLPVAAAQTRYRLGPEIGVTAGAVFAVTKDISLNARLQWRGKRDDFRGEDPVPATKSTHAALELAVGRTLRENVQVVVGARLPLDRQGIPALHIGFRLH